MPRPPYRTHMYMTHMTRTTIITRQKKIRILTCTSFQETKQDMNPHVHLLPNQAHAQKTTTQGRTQSTKLYMDS